MAEDHRALTAQNTGKNAKIGLFRLDRFKSPFLLTLNVYAIIDGALLFGVVISLIRCDLLNPEIARLTIFGASRSSLLECTLSPSQTGNLARLSARILTGEDKVNLMGISIGSVRGVAVFSACQIIEFGSGIDSLSPESAVGKSQVLDKLNCSSVTSSQEFSTNSAQLGGI